MCANRLNDWNTMPTSDRSCASLLALGGQRLAVDRDGAGVDRLEPVDGAAQRRLARARRPEHHHDLAAVDLEVDVLEDVQAAEMLVDAPASRSSARTSEAVGVRRASDSSVSMRSDLTQVTLSSPSVSGIRRIWLSAAARPYHWTVTSTVTRRRACRRTCDASRRGRQRTYQVRTYGCQMNVHDSERLAGLLEDGRLPARRRRRRRRRRGLQHLRGAGERRQQAVRQPQPPRAAQGRPTPTCRSPSAAAWRRRTATRC